MSTSDPNKVVSESRFVTATPQEIFNLLADPAQHQLIDGSGSVKNANSSSPERLSLGVKYKIDNEVVEFDEPNQIAWRHFGGHIWRYKLEAVEGGTQVTEQFDWNTAKSHFMMRVLKYPTKNRASIVATLDRLAAHFAKQ